jgi:acyl-CoA synthetase (NDP forming)
MAEGIAEAASKLKPDCPIITCIRGTGEEKAQEILRNAGLKPLFDTEEAVRQAVAFCKGGQYEYLIDRTVRVLVQGITGSEGIFWTKHMIGIGTRVVAGVTPGKGGQSVEGIPVFHTLRQALREHPADASLLFVPPRLTKDAVFEALDAGIQKMVTVADGIPLHESVQIRKAARSCNARVIGETLQELSAPVKP